MYSKRDEVFLAKVCDKGTILNRMYMKGLHFLPKKLHKIIDKHRARSLDSDTSNDEIYEDGKRNLAYTR